MTSKSRLCDSVSVHSIQLKQWIYIDRDSARCNGQNVNNLKHADDTVFLTDDEEKLQTILNKKAQLSLTNPRDACEKFARFT